MSKTSIITGSSGGIGTATARVFLKEGWRVVGIDKKETDELKGRVDFICADVSSPKALEDAFKKAGAMLGKLDVLINNAAVQVCKSTIETDVSDWDSVMNTNLRSISLSVRYAYPFFRIPGASIVNVSSVHAIATSVNISAYAASKGGALALTRALALELANDGIRVNCLLPGAVDTNMLRSGVNRGHLAGSEIDEKLKSLAEKTPLGRIGKPEEIAQAILFLADNDRSSFITGASLAVDGGALARLGTE